MLYELYLKSGSYWAYPDWLHAVTDKCIILLLLQEDVWLQRIHESGAAPSAFFLYIEQVLTAYSLHMNEGGVTEGTVVQTQGSVHQILAAFDLIYVKYVMT